MAPALEPAFVPGRPVWPLAGMTLADYFEPDDPELAIPNDALRPGPREAPERLFSARYSSLIIHMPTEPLGPQPLKKSEGMRKWKLALVASCVFHAAVALFFIQATDESVQIEGAEYTGTSVLGNASDDQTSAGDITEFDNPVEVTMITMLEAKPVETIDVETVPVETTAEVTEVVEPAVSDTETIQPVEETPVQNVEPATADKVEPEAVEQAEPTERAEATEAVEPASAAAVTETAPEVLATDRPLPVEENNFVQVPAKAVETADVSEPLEQTQTVTPADAETAKAEPAEAVKPTETVKAELEQTAKVEAIEQQPIARPEPRPVGKKASAQVKPIEKKSAPARQEPRPKEAKEGKKVAGKAAAKPSKAGNGGQGQADTKLGQADGTAGLQASRSKGGTGSAAGNAALSNYPGKVASKLRRALVYPAEAKRQKLRGKVQVSFVVSAGGGVGSIRIVSSSGSPILDKAALETVRRAAPFPTIPDGAGRSSWPFSVPLAFSR